MRKAIPVIVVTGIAGAVLAATTYAHAAPSANKLQTDCNTSVTKSCIMHKTVGYEKYEGEARQAGSTAVNCGDLGEYEYTVGGEVTVGSETSTSVSVGVSAGFFDVVEVSVEASFGESFSRSRTSTEELMIPIPPLYEAWVMYEPTMQMTEVWPDIWYNDKVDDHWHWWLDGNAPGIQVLTPANAPGKKKGFVRPIPVEDLAEECPANSEPETSSQDVRGAVDIPDFIKIVDRVHSPADVGEIVSEVGDNLPELPKFTVPGTPVGGD